MQTEMDKITVIEEAAAQGRPIGFCYTRDVSDSTALRSMEFTERRQLVPDPDEPIRYNQSGEAYVIGEDIARGAPRSFTLDKITEVSVG